MDRLIFTATTALNEYRLDRQSLTHELANVSTTGFKKSFEVANRSVRVEGDGFDSRFLPRAFTMNRVDLTNGPRILTGRSLDIAMDNQTVLGVQSNNGDLAFTRRGDFQVGPDGLLRTGEGHLVLNEDRDPITLPVGSVTYDIRADGTLSFMDPSAPELGSTSITRLFLRDASETPLSRREDGLFTPSEGGPDFENGTGVASVTVGVLEGSNVSTVHTLVKFIDHMRSFEMQTKVIKEMKDNDARGEALMRLS
jgi:flagellar basal-body rod protein FlgF